MKRALLLIDLQNDFVPGGALAVREGDQVIPIANRLSALKGAAFDLVVATQDWHPANHGSFASNNGGAAVGSTGELGGLPQVMWPNHCVQNTRGAEFVSSLDMSRVDKVIRKGTDAAIDSYSGFFDNGHKKETEMASYLRSQNVDEVVVMGLATDYCVKFTALDAVQLGFKTTLVRDASRAVNLTPGDEAAAVEEMRKAGVTVVTSAEILSNSK
jgi:nicotinamidase/pyrazinamidase